MLMKTLVVQNHNNITCFAAGNKNKNITVSDYFTIFNPQASCVLTVTLQTSINVAILQD